MPEVKSWARVLGADLAGFEPGFFDQRAPDADERVRLAAEIAAHPAFDHIVRYLGHARGLGFDPADLDVIRRAFRAGIASHEADRKSQASTYSMLGSDRRHRKHPPVVYYMRLDATVKIGITIDIVNRLASISPQGLMAIEPGTPARERERHRQFAHLRLTGEWFRLDPSLGDHIRALRAKLESDAGVSTEEWLDRRRYRGPDLRGTGVNAGPRHCYRPTALPGKPLPADAAELVPACVAARAVGVSYSLFGLWRRRGAIEPVAQTPKGRKLYRLADAQAVPRRKLSADTWPVAG